MMFSFSKFTAGFTAGSKKPGRSNPAGPTKLRSVDYKLTEHHHGKSKVRVLRVRQVQRNSLVLWSARRQGRGCVHRPYCCASAKSSPQPPSLHQDGARHTVQHYDVATRLFSPVTDVCYTEGDNSQLIATDTQKNTVYIVAKRSKVRAAFRVAVLLSRTADWRDTTPPLS
jgi:hypothetical protein